MTARHGHLPRVLNVAADSLAAAAACAAAYAVRIPLEIVPVPGRVEPLPARYLEALPFAVTVVVGSVALAGLHGRRHLARTPGLADGLRAAGLALVMLLATAFLYRPTFQYSRLAIVIAAVFYVPLFLAARHVAVRVLRRVARDPRYRSAAIVIGGGRPAEALARAIVAEPWMALDVVGVCEVGEAPAAWPSAPRLKGVTEARQMLDSGAAREVFVALPAEHAGRLPAILTAISQSPADVCVVPDLGGAVLLNPSAALVGGLPVVSVRERPLYGLRAAAKRALDAGLSLVLRVALAPLLLALFLAVRLTSPGPALHRQERMGLDSRRFEMLKFRTMRTGAEAASGPVFATRGDPRVTALGRVLRRFSLDELPQLVNVLRGEMSLVGPRPERAPFIEEFRARLPGYMLRHSVKAGMTGWAQVHGLRGDSSLEERLRYDLEYIDRWSLVFDLEILGRTAVQVLVGTNAY